MKDLTTLLDEYYNKRGLTWPTTEEALFFALTELGEACEWLLLKNPERRWVRNNPKDKATSFNKAEFGIELGDVIMMLIVAGLQASTDPLLQLREKLERKLENLPTNEPQKADSTGAQTLSQLLLPGISTLTCSDSGISPTTEESQ